jgi:predicted lysophospholipase L1 biosynthesis ABC-type transport system permease subunit
MMLGFKGKVLIFTLFFSVLVVGTTTAIAAAAAATTMGRYHVRAQHFSLRGWEMTLDFFHFKNYVIKIVSHT